MNFSGLFLDLIDPGPVETGCGSLVGMAAGALLCVGTAVVMLKISEKKNNKKDIPDTDRKNK